MRFKKEADMPQATCYLTFTMTIPKPGSDPQNGCFMPKVAKLGATHFAEMLMQKEERGQRGREKNIFKFVCVVKQEISRSTYRQLCWCIRKMAKKCP